MTPKIAIVYTKEHNESIVEKNRLKKLHPNALIVETSGKKNKTALTNLLEDDVYEVKSAHKSLNARVAKSEKARVKAKEDALEAQHKALEDDKKANKKAAKKTKDTSKK
jgi:hypothetical protein